MARFSKSAIVEYLVERITHLEREFHFDPRNGYAQVEKASSAINREYGAYEAFKSLLENIESGYITK